MGDVLQNKIKMLEAELTRERERFNIIFQNTTVSIWDYDFATRQIIQPTRSKELHGFDTVVDNVPDSLIESGFVHPDSAQEFRNMYDKLFAGEMHAEGVFRVQTADRSGYWYEYIRYKTLMDENGVPYAAVGMSTDVTEDMENKKTMERWRSLLTGTLGKKGTVLEFDLTEDHFICVENSPMSHNEEWSAYKFDEYIDAYCRKYVYLADIEMVRNRLQRASLLMDSLDGKREFSMEYRMMYGEEVRWVQLHAKFIRPETDRAVHFFMLHMDITENKKKELELQRKADSDTVTGLLNNRAFTERAKDVFEQITGQSDILLILELNEFTDINISYGHMTGERILYHVGKCITDNMSELREHTICARVNTSEFYILFYGTEKSLAESYVRKLSERLSEPVLGEISISVSMGMAVYPTDGKNLSELIMAAERAVYYVNHYGSENYCFYGDIWQGENETKLRRQQFMSESIAGGMMGFYLEKDAPFYFIDERMLFWLGYDNEEEFVKSIDGYLENCVHPDDRSYVVSAVGRQLAHGSRYEVDYRIRRKDGTYIWMNDIGARMTAPDGRTAVTSVCHDITAEKEHASLIQRLVHDANGGIALYRIQEDWSLVLFYATENMGLIAGYSDEEYRSLCRNSAIESVYEMDRETVMETIRKAVTEDTAISISYRIPHRDGGYVWITGTFSRHGEDMGRPVLRAVYMPLPMQYELQLQTLNADTISVYVIDTHTKELYYANDASFRLHDVPACDITGRKCHEIYFESDKTCDVCILNIAKEVESMPFQFESGDRIVSIEIQDSKWNNKDITVVYGRDVTEQVKAQEELEQSREMMEAACSFADIWVFSYDVDKKIVYTDEKLQREFGFKERAEDFPEVVFKRKLILPEFEELFRKQFELLRAGKPEVIFEIRSHMPDGKVHWVRFKAQIMNNLSAEKRIAVISAQIIDAEKAMEARLEIEHQKQQANDQNMLFYYIANVTQDSIVECKAETGGMSDCEAKASMEDFRKAGMHYITFLYDAERIERVHERERLLRNYHQGIVQEEYRAQITTSDGRIIWTRHTMQLLQDPSSRDILLYEYIYDINSNQIIEAMLKMEMNYGYEVIGNLFVRADQFTFLEIEQSSGIPELKYLKFNDYIHSYAEKYMHPEDVEKYLRHYTNLNETASKPECTHSEVLYRTYAADGSIRYHKDDNYFYDKEKGIFLLTRREYTDIVRTEEREKHRLEEALARAEEAGKAKTDFLARMSHDMRTPMNAIMGLTALTVDAAENPHEVKINMSKMNSASEYLLGLVNDILDMAKIEERSLNLNLEPYKYRDFLINIKTTFLPQCEMKGIKLSIEETDINPVIICDRTRLNQIFYNIMSNAVRYTPAGGTVSYQVKNIQISGGRMSVDFIVQDNGIGMSEDFQKQMFKPFTRENTAVTAELQGSGLGLSITRQLVELMGGKIHVESQKGCGTTVIISLEFECQDKIASEEALTKTVFDDEHFLEGKVALLVEDHPLNAEIAAKLLEMRNMTVIHAENGRIAVNMFNASEPYSIDIVLMDIRMPEMDGLEASAALRALPRPDASSVPIVAMSANAYPEDVKKSLAAGMNAHLSKPIDMEAMFSTIERQIRDREGEDC